ncbi:unnamed protein product [Onchocerca ochengi]|uniref:Uncharacterized protein n=1 Tax=Onchocerca ochengi TaxID=42157 RepID=A0A182EQV3_ONCOC|nr:unnamed protein product [Onchocerca ochengi]
MPLKTDSTKVKLSPHNGSRFCYLMSLSFSADPYSNSLRSPAASTLSPFADDAYGRFFDRKPTAPRNALVRFG